MEVKFKFQLLVALLPPLMALDTPNPCRWTDPVFGNSYDLTPLKKPTEYIDIPLI